MRNFNTLKAYEELVNAGYPDLQAKVIANILHDFFNEFFDNLVTRNDLLLTKNELNNTIQKLENRLELLISIAKK